MTRQSRRTLSRCLACPEAILKPHCSQVRPPPRDPGGDLSDSCNFARRLAEESSLSSLSSLSPRSIAQEVPLSLFHGTTETKVTRVTTVTTGRASAASESQRKTRAFLEAVPLLALLAGANRPLLCMIIPLSCKWRAASLQDPGSAKATAGWNLNAALHS